MTDVIIIYDSKTGNTEKAAAYVLEGVRLAGSTGEMKRTDEAKPEDAARAKGIIIGSYCMRDGCSEKIDTFMKGLSAARLKGKPGAAFGSYKFSGGQVRVIEAGLEKLGVRRAASGVNSVRSPDEATAGRLRELGKKVTAAIQG